MRISLHAQSIKRKKILILFTDFEKGSLERMELLEKQKSASWLGKR
jgi:hypothetical protein